MTFVDESAFCTVKSPAVKLLVVFFSTNILFSSADNDKKNIQN